MLEVAAKYFVEAGGMFRTFTTFVHEIGDVDELIEHRRIEPLLDGLSQLYDFGCRLELQVCGELIKDMFDRYGFVNWADDPDDSAVIGFPQRTTSRWESTKTPDVTWKTVREDIRVLQRCFEAELRTRMFFCMESADVSLLRSEAPMGQETLMLFPSAEYDVRQAARCLAMKCDTAAVLHLMRVLETGLGSLAVHFSVSFEHRNWENIIADIGKAIKTISHGSDKPADWKSREKVFSDVAKEFTGDIT